ncbi:MAG: ABC transporter permease [Gemmatimonadetes bacterium]|nr:ABC transporter permease [Gemmatimonadota bacterium]
MTETRLAIVLVRKVYRLFLYGYAREYRIAFGPAMEQTFVTVCVQTFTHRGAIAALRTALAELLDTARVALQQRFESWARQVGRMGSGGTHGQSPNGRRDPLNGSWRESVGQALADTRHAFRSVAKRPGYSAVVLATIAIGVGATTAIFSVVDTVMMRPLPYRDPDGLFDLWNYIPDKDLLYGAHSLQAARQWREADHIFEQVELYDTEAFIVQGSGDPELISGSKVSVGLMPMLGVAPQIGRGFVPREAERGSERVVIISDGLWKRRFGSDTSVVGQSLRLGTENHTVIGVMPASFRFPSARVQLWVPVTAEPGVGRALYQALARMKTGISLQQAQEEADRIALRLQESHPRDAGWYIRLRSHNDLRVERRNRVALWVLLGAVGFVLLIACANIANLSLSVAMSRQHEMAIRAALGAGRFRIARHMLIENLGLCLVGGGLGVLLANWGLPLILRFAPSDLTFMTGADISIDRRVLAFALLLSTASGVLSGLIPAIRGSRADKSGALCAAARRLTSTREHHRMRGALVVLEVGLSLVLLIGAALMVNSFVRLNRVDLGFRTDDLLTFYVNPETSRYPTASVQDVFYDQVAERIAALPGVEGVTMADGLPPSGGGISFGVTPQAEGHEPPVTRPDFVMPSARVSENYFEVMDIALREGRPFEPADSERDVMIVSETMVQMFWGAESPIGKRFRLGTESPWITVVGVAADVKQFGPVDPFGDMEFYRPLANTNWDGRAIAVRAPDAMALLPAVKQLVWQLDDRLPVTRINLMEDLLAESIAQPRFLLLLVTSFAIIAVTLAGIGMYGVISYSVSQRERELGIRMALGAQRGTVRRLVLKQGMSLAVVGTLLGLLGAYGMTKFLDTLLFDVEPTDPVTFATVAVGLIVAALFACYVPAHRATKVDPMVALRGE